MGRDRRESWLDGCGTVVLVLIGLTLLLGGGTCAVADSMVARSAITDPDAGRIFTEAVVVALVGLALLIIALRGPRK